eukprot:Transcript_25193.p5 GENE.Transcript_25193~~Transcript_25193.p5  ORF type:complete len:133 (+),score=75.78 Transcript_25193:1127-1525(+)
MTPPPPPPPPEAEGGAAAGAAADGALQAADLDPLLAAFKTHSDAELATTERLAAVYDALTADDAPPPAALREAVDAALKAMPTSLLEDEQTLEKIAGGDPRAGAVVAYRAQRKRQLLLAQQILKTYAERSRK